MRKAAPIRTCVGCGEQSNQSQLLRFFLGKDGELIAGSGQGRGGYLHLRRQCVQGFAKARSGFVRSLRVVVPREIRARFVADIEQRAMLS
ncbi:MAG TPA: DUF448 domain-containing protein [Methylomirabilota bacterium]|jgi:predicted RNA-binding protein YlxR (DUF448 family)|nr:DUF448 domain-containing protein [Methylomirabilota bacterium]